MRRGALHRAAVENGCRVVALGHHYDDAAETALMNLLFEGRFAAFQPVTDLDRRGVTLIRPFLYIEEKLIIPLARELPVLKSPCPADGHTKRQEIKELIRSLGKTYPQIKQRLFNALLKLPEWERAQTP
jgi:tRNA(Ile)-lysidine synthase TilS/MesJ